MIVLTQHLEILNGRRRRQRGTLLFLLVVAIVYFSAAKLTNYSSVKTMMTFTEAISWITKNLFPDERAFSRWSEIYPSLLETLLMSIAATTTASFFALVLALLGARTTKLPGAVGEGLSWLARFFASFFRNVPEIVWAMLFLLSFGQSLITGFMALLFVSIGTLTRAFMESIDEASHHSVEALMATGASYLQIVFQAIIPQAIAQFISWILYMIETNVRSATLIGILSGSGIGHTFNIYYRKFQYPTAGLIILSILVIVLMIETLSNFIRRAIL